MNQLSTIGFRLNYPHYLQGFDSSAKERLQLQVEGMGLLSSVGYDVNLKLKKYQDCRKRWTALKIGESQRPVHSMYVLWLQWMTFCDQNIHIAL